MPLASRTLRRDLKGLIPKQLRGVSVPQQPTTIGEHLRRRRAALAFTQRQVANRLGVSVVAISTWELDKAVPTRAHQKAILEFLGYDPFEVKSDPSPTTQGLDLSLGEHLYRRRIALGLRQADVAAKIGVSRRTIGKWEANEVEPQANCLDGIAVFLGFNPS